MDASSNTKPLKPLETVEALYDFVQTEDKLLAIQMAVAMDLQNRQELLELHHKNNDTFGIALETSRNTADALLVLTSIHKAPKEIVTLISTLKNAGSVIFKGVKYTYSEGKIVAQKIPSPNANVNTNVPTSQNLPNVYGDGDLPNIDSGQNHGGVSLKEHIQANIADSQKARKSSNFKNHANSKNVHRIEHNAKLTTTTDGNLSVTHGLGYSSKSIFNKYPEKTEIKITGIDEQAEFLSQAVNGLPKEQAKVILEIAKNSNTSVVFGGSRVRGNFHDGSDVDIGFGNVNANKSKKIKDKIRDKSTNIDGALKLEPTHITPNNETLNIPKIESPEEFFQRGGVRSNVDEKAGQPYMPSGSITVNTDGTIMIIPPNQLK